MPSFGEISWLTPATMTGSLLAGTLFAVGHHFFYSSLNGTAAASWSFNVWGFGITQQQINTSAGTALAFLAKVFFVLAISIAYTQAFWRAVRKQTTQMHTLDTLTSLLDNILAFFRVATWIKYPLLLLLALSVWLVPIASVITPATLSVIVAPIMPPVSSLVNVPSADFKSLKFTIPGSWDGPMYYNGPSLEASRIAQASAFLGSILPISPPAGGLNASWVKEFSGPYLKCSNVSDSLRHDIQKSIVLTYINGTACQGYKNYISWTANTGPYVGAADGSYIPTSYNQVPFWAKKPYTLNSGTLGPLNYISNGSPSDVTFTNSTDPATIYFAVNPFQGTQTPGMCQSYYRDFAAGNFDGYWDDTTMLQCQLHNATYETKFNYTNGQQSIDVSFPDLEEALPVQPLWELFFDDTKCAAINTNLTWDYQKHIGDGLNCTIDPLTLERLSFQSIMDAFGKIFIGTVMQGQGGGSKLGTLIDKTSVQQTQLVNTKELGFMAYDSSWLGFRNFSDGYNTTNPELQSLWDWQSTDPRRSLSDAIEELFQNITISMLSSSAFQPNKSSSFQNAPVNVTFYDFQTIYAYAGATLWLAYGIAIGISLIGVVIGLACILLNGASFSNDFSTTLRATRNADLSVEIKGDDSDGKDPLPKYLANASITFVGGVVSSARDEAVQTTSVQPKSHVPLLTRRGS